MFDAYAWTGHDGRSPIEVVTQAFSSGWRYRLGLRTGSALLNAVVAIRYTLLQVLVGRDGVVANVTIHGGLVIHSDHRVFILGHVVINTRKRPKYGIFVTSKK